MTLEQLKSKAARKLNDVLRSLILGEDIFPLVIPIAKPKTTADVMKLRETIRLIKSQSREVLGYGFTVEWQIVNSRRHGQNEFPKKLSFNNAEDFLRYVGATDEAGRISSNVETILEHYPRAKVWCASNLSLIRKEAEVIRHAMLVVEYLKDNRAPNCYARQLPITVPTKFIEQERKLLDSFMQDQLPQCYVQGDGTFEDRIGLLTKESLIEFRSLDSEINSLPFRHAMATAKEMADKPELFQAFETVLVIENHITFLTAPSLPNTLAIMGNGFAAHRLGQVHWLSGKRLLYWGDIDLSGFSILAKFRQSYPTTASVMMDQITFDRFCDLQQYHQADQTIQDTQLKNLSVEETALVGKLKLNGGLRLEQEHIDYSYAKETLKASISTALS
ncbi:MAG: Wadjet anti-phage system protein JetD domain-containing protein [Opitutaceae bacterium]